MSLDDGTSCNADARGVKVASLGLFILDTFEWRNEDGTSQSVKQESVIGGGGTYAILGSRMWLPAESLGILVDRGNDWPNEVQKQLQEFGPIWHYRDKDAPTTRALNLYTGQHRNFKYLNERLRLEPIDLPVSLRTCEWLHFVCSPSRALVIISQLSTPFNRTPSWKPHLVYEPIPDRCIPSELPSLRQVLPHLKVFSPNHEEAASFFGISPSAINAQGRKGIEDLAERFFHEGAKCMIVIRSGPLGAYAIDKMKTENGTWVDAYHGYEANLGKVVDVTGAGNSFLGGLMAGLSLSPDNLLLATQRASVSASFTIEQFGLPKMQVAADGLEQWNGVIPSHRLQDLQTRRKAPMPPIP